VQVNVEPFSNQRENETDDEEAGDVDNQSA
jgi:hypothetical protein